MTCPYVFASWLAAQAIRIAPASRRDWLLAMRDELQHVPNHRRIGFAAGAVWVAITERTFAMKSLPLRPLETAVMLFAAMLALALTANGLRLFEGYPAVATAMFGMSLIWGGVFLATLLERYRLLVRTACAGALLAFAIGLMTIMPQRDFAFAASADLLRALSLEGVILFAVLIAAVSIAQLRAEPAT